MSNTDQLPFFVYGTLRPGQGNYRRFLGGRTAQEVPALLDGHAVFDLGIPYVVECTAGATVVVGDLVFVAPQHYEDVLGDLDRLEGYNARRPGGHYERQALPVRHQGAGGSEASALAWVYLAGAAVRARLVEACPVPGGDWVAASASRLCGRP